MSVRQLRWALNQNDLPPLDKLALIFLADRSDAEGWSFYSQETLGKKCDVTRKTIREALKRLEGAGLILRVHRSKEGLRTSDHIRISPGHSWVKSTLGMVQNLPTIPSSPYGVRKNKKKGQAEKGFGSGFRLIDGGRS